MKIQSSHYLQKALLFSVLVSFVTSATILGPQALKPYMFTETISGDVTPIQPTKFGYSKSSKYPVDTYEIVMMRYKHQFLPAGFPSTEIFAYAGKIGNEFKPQYPGPYILSFKDTPIYVIWTNQITGKHILPVDLTPPFDMIKNFLDEIPTVPHLHGLQTEMGSDGQPMAFWTRTGKLAQNYFSLKSSQKKINQAVYRYYNTKQGLFWYHDHTMAITRLNVYAGLAGLYEIVDCHISLEERNILKLYGNIERKHFAITDKTFYTDGSLYYPDRSLNPSFTSWVPGFIGNVMIVNGKAWPKINVVNKKYRFAFLNSCQTRSFLLSFENNGKKLDFHIFRRDSDFLQKPVTVQEYLFLVGSRMEIFIDFTNITGEVIVRNTSPNPNFAPPPNDLTGQIFKIVIKPQPRLLQQFFIPIAASGFTFPQLISNKLNFYYKTKGWSFPDLDFLDQPQSPNLYLPIISRSTISQTQSQSATAVISSAAENIFTSSSGVSISRKSQNTSTSFSRNSSSTSINTSIMISSLTSVKSNQNLMDTIHTNLDEVKDSIFNFMDTMNQNNGIYAKNGVINDKPYPRFNQGAPVFPVLIEFETPQGVPESFMIDGVSLKLGCQGSTYRQGQIYDFYIINLTPAPHPIHIHIVNFQVIGRFPFDVTKYQADWFKKNGGNPGKRGFTTAPLQLDPRPYKTGAIAPPAQEEKQFLDVIPVPAGQVTIARVRFSNHTGKSFPFDISGSRYVWHCHILEHEDNEMMRYFCIQ